MNVTKNEVDIKRGGMKRWRGETKKQRYGREELEMVRKKRTNQRKRRQSTNMVD